MKLLRRLAVGLGLLAVFAGAAVWWLNVRGDEEAVAASPPSADAAVVERGRDLARAANCIGCHSLPGQPEGAGGRPIETPFGTVYAPNITPDETTGIGRWSAADFRRALHNGRSRDGRLLYPAFPYPSFTQITRADGDALYAYLRSLAPAQRVNTPHALPFPYRTQAALALWRALFFRPADFAPDTTRSAAWNRGKYLVDALGHCAACHSGRNALGGIRVNAEFAGGLMPDASWYAPSLTSAAEAGVAHWPRAEVVRLLKTGVAAGAGVSGPMAEVVFDSTQHLNDADLGAMAEFLAALPQRERERDAAKPADGATLARGDRVYRDHCAACHGKRGEGAAAIYPALAGNRAVTMEPAINVVQLIRRGGFAPATAGNPRPFGMPPFFQVLNDADVAAVASYIRQSWGNRASAVSELDASRVR
jgi:mono/diheme cytochrome c family protein